MLIRTIRYALVGGLGTSVHYCLLLVLIFTGTKPIVATAIGATCGAVVNFLFCRWWVFSSFQTKKMHSAFRFSVVVVFGVVLNTSLFALVLPALGLGVAQLISTIAVFLFGYWMNSQWTFPQTAIRHRTIH